MTFPFGSFVAATDPPFYMPALIAMRYGPSGAVPLTDASDGDLGIVYGSAMRSGSSPASSAGSWPIVYSGAALTVVSKIITVADIQSGGFASGSSWTLLVYRGVGSLAYRAMLNGNDSTSFAPAGNSVGLMIASGAAPTLSPSPFRKVSDANANGYANVYDRLTPPNTAYNGGAITTSGLVAGQRTFVFEMLGLTA